MNKQKIQPLDWIFCKKKRQRINTHPLTPKSHYDSTPRKATFWKFIKTRK